MTQSEQIHDALSDAFSPASLRRMLANKLDRDLDDYASQGDKRHVIFELVQGAEREGFLDELIAAAQRDNPGNEKLAALSAARPRPGPIFHVPAAQNNFFTGRNAQLLQLDQELSANGIAALTGLGGIGKTQLAVEYAYRHRDAYPDGIFWLTAADPWTWQAGLAEIATRLGLAVPDPDKSLPSKAPVGYRSWTRSAAPPTTASWRAGRGRPNTPLHTWGCIQPSPVCGAATGSSERSGRCDAAAAHR